MKPKKVQKALAEEVQGRDLFRTPRYATDLILPFIPVDTKWIWEPAAGEHHISSYLKELGWDVLESDIRGENSKFNFITDKAKDVKGCCIITNPPYSLKSQFVKKCIELGVPFALLIPADPCGWLLEYTRDYNLEWLIPTSRINYITPNILERVNRTYGTNFSSIEEISKEYLLRDSKASSSTFHSMWLTRYFNLPDNPYIVTLTKEMKENI